MLKNKKIITSILALSILVTPYVSNGHAVKASQLSLSPSEVTKVSGILNNVLSSEQEIMKTGKAKDCSNVINDPKLLQVIQKEQKFNEDWNSKINFKIYDYTSNVKINNITQLSGNKYKLDVTFHADLKLSKDSQIPSSMSDNYVFEVENKSGQWVINKMLEKVYSQDAIKEKKSNKIKAGNNPTLKTSNNDILSNNILGDDILTNNDMILDTKIKEFDLKSANIDNSAKSYKEMIKKTKEVLTNGSEKAAPAYSGCNRYGVRNYATQYAYAPHNPNYYYYDGADCTNFASQAAYEGGGVPQSSYWCPYNSNWNTVEGFYNYMISNGYITGDPALTDLYNGDMIQWRHWWSTSYNHTTIVTGFGYNDEPLLSAHSTDRQNYPISNFWNGFDYARKLHFW